MVAPFGTRNLKLETQSLKLRTQNQEPGTGTSEPWNPGTPEPRNPGTLRRCAHEIAPRQSVNYRRVRAEMARIGGLSGLLTVCSCMVRSHFCKSCTKQIHFVDCPCQPSKVRNSASTIAVAPQISSF